MKVPLSIIFEKSLNEGVLPQIWKCANVTAIFKSGSKSKPSNYRPISLTSVPGKIMERIIRNALVDHMTQNKLFNDAQHGFIAGRSCVTQLLEFLEDVTEALDNGFEVDVIYLDFAKAFDKVPHRRLLRKIEAYGVKGKLLVWIREFLNDRKQRVMVNGSYSEWEKITSGIPQGSVLGPILFLIYINDLPDVLRCLLKLFADDAKLYRVVKSAQDCGDLQVDVFKSEEWAKVWEMFYNKKKCKHLRVGNPEPTYTYVMSPDSDPHEIERVDFEKDLGVIVDKKLNFREHISSKIAKANRNLGMVFRTFTYIDRDMFSNLYKSLIRPHLEYASPVWSPMYKKDMIALENVQRRATRLVKTLSNLSYPERLKSLGIPTLEYRRERADVIEVYKIINGIDKVNSEKFFQFATYRSTRGNQLKLFKKRARLNVRINAFSLRVIDSWNSLPNSVVLAPSLNSFKSRLNVHWRSHPRKFEPACYAPGTTTTARLRQRSNPPIEVV